MARKPKCRICKKQLDTDSAYCVVVNKTKKYYCSAEEYQKAEDEKLQHKLKEAQLTLHIEDCIGKTANTTLYKEISEWKRVATVDKLNAYFKEHKDNIIVTLNRMAFKDEYSKIRYFSAIIKNSINDFIEPVEEKKETVNANYDYMDYNNKFKAKSRKDLSEFL